MKTPSTGHSPGRSRVGPAPSTPAMKKSARQGTPPRRRAPATTAVGVLSGTSSAAGAGAAGAREPLAAAARQPQATAELRLQLGLDALGPPPLVTPPFPPPVFPAILLWLCSTVQTFLIEAQRCFGRAQHYVGSVASTPERTGSGGPQSLVTPPPTSPTASATSPGCAATISSLLLGSVPALVIFVPVDGTREMPAFWSDSVRTTSLMRCSGAAGGAARGQWRLLPRRRGGATGYTARTTQSNLPLLLSA